MTSHQFRRPPQARVVFRLRAGAALGPAGRAALSWLRPWPGVPLPAPLNACGAAALCHALAGAGRRVASPLARCCRPARPRTSSAVGVLEAARFSTAGSRATAALSVRAAAVGSRPAVATKSVTITAAFYRCVGPARREARATGSERVRPEQHAVASECDW